MNPVGKLNSCSTKLSGSKYHMRMYSHLEVHFLLLLGVQRVAVICKVVQTSQRGEMTSSLMRLREFRRAWENKQSARTG